MLFAIETAVESFHIQQRYNGAKSRSAPPLNGITWHYNTGLRDGRVPLIRVEAGAMKSSWAIWGAPLVSGEDKYVGQGWPIQPAYVPATSYSMRLANDLHPWAPYEFRISLPGPGWFMVAASWFGAPALDDRQCNMRVRSGSSLPRGLPYQPIVLSAEEWARGGSGGSLSLETMVIQQA
jgi:hypothetical protein